MRERIPGITFLMQKLQGQYTVADRLGQFEEVVQKRWQPYFERKGVAYPPQKLIFVAFKQEKVLNVYAASAGKTPRLVRSFPVLGASGVLGPKLREGDRQVPEGFYRIESLNPNSAFHLSLRINYPNEFDRAQAAGEGRADLGSDIMIHGSSASIGCLAMGDEGAEDLFVLAAKVGVENIEVVLSPLDFRIHDVPANEARPAWVKEMYAQLKNRIKSLPVE